MTVERQWNIQTMCSGVQQAGGKGARSPLPFLKAEKNSSDFGKKCPGCIHLWVKFVVQNSVLRLSRAKCFEIFVVETLLLSR